jgi:DNA-binding LytR/AlgR family response regulator
MGGMEIVRRLDEPVLPCIVIVTAFGQHALQAFEVGAVDYLLKPVAEDRLACRLDQEILTTSVAVMYRLVLKHHSYRTFPNLQ